MNRCLGELTDKDKEILENLNKNKNFKDLFSNNGNIFTKNHKKYGGKKYKGGAGWVANALGYLFCAIIAGLSIWGLYALLKTAVVRSALSYISDIITDRAMHCARPYLWGSLYKVVTQLRFLLQPNPSNIPISLGVQYVDHKYVAPTCIDATNESITIYNNLQASIIVFVGIGVIGTAAYSCDYVINKIQEMLDSPCDLQPADGVSLMDLPDVDDSSSSSNSPISSSRNNHGTKKKNNKSKGKNNKSKGKNNKSKGKKEE
jgi:hypothetical protein